MALDWVESELSHELSLGYGFFIIFFAYFLYPAVTFL